MVSLCVYITLIIWLILLKVSFSFYYITTTALCLFILFMELDYKKVNKKMVTELGQLEWFLSEVRHRYYVHEMVDEAIKEAMEVCKHKNMKLEAGFIYEILVANDSKVAMTEYRKRNNNRFYSMFVTLCLLVLEFGDRKVDGKSLFLENLKNLRSEIHIEIQNRRGIRYAFSGLTILILFPICTLKLIEHWGLSNLPELSTYYHGSYAILFYIFLFLITLGLFYLFYILKIPYEIQPKKHNLLYFLSNISIIKNILTLYSNHYYYKVIKINRILKDIGESMDFRLFLLKRMVISISTYVLSLLLCELGIQGSFPWYAYLFQLTVTIIAYWIPYLLVLYRRQVMLLCMEDEVLQYHTIFLMLMYFDRISVYELLEAMEEFSIIFKPSIHKCLMDYEGGQKDALIKMKESENCMAFKKLVDNLLMCDEIGVVRALDEIAIEQTFHNDNRKQVNAHNLQKRSALCQFFAFFPLFITAGIYLIVPFVAVSITKLLDMSKEVLGK